MIENATKAFADTVEKLLETPKLSEQLGRSARTMTVEEFSWGGAAGELEVLMRSTKEAQK